MIKFKKLYVIIFFVLFIGIAACQTKPVTDVEEVTEITEHKDETIANGVNEEGSDEENIVKSVSGDDSNKSILESQIKDLVTSTDKEPASAIGIEDRLLICPEDEDIPESIKLVFTDYARFDLVFDLGFDVLLEENGNEGDLSIYYFTSEEAFQEQYKITTDIIEYSYSGPYSFMSRDALVYWRAYRVMDLDDDGINELVYIVSLGDSTPSSEDYYIIFHEIDGKVYAYVSYLCCADFTEDGLLDVGHGTIDYVYKIASFDTERFYIDCFLYMYAFGDEWKYILNGKRVTSEEGHKYYKENYLDKGKALFKSKDGLVGFGK